MVGIVEGRVDRPRVLPEQPRPEPVVVAVLHDAEVRRRRDDEANTLGQAPVAEGGPCSARAVPRVPEEGDPRRAGERLAVKPSQLLLETAEHVAIG